MISNFCAPGSFAAASILKYISLCFTRHFHRLCFTGADDEPHLLGRDYELFLPRHVLCSLPHYASPSTPAYFPVSAHNLDFDFTQPDSDFVFVVTALIIERLIE